MIKQGQFIGEEISGYRIGEKLGKGGMGEAYQAFHLSDNNLVAIKFLPPNSKEEFSRLFEREAEVHSRLQHQNIIQFLDFGVQEIKGINVPYIVMECATEGSLKDLIKLQKILPLGLTVDLLLQTSDGLEYAHQRRVLHRDIKPANILLDREQNRLIAKLADFGIYIGAHRLDSNIMQMNTQVGPKEAGTPEFMPWEQFEGNARIPSDIYALSVLAYLLVTGNLPFKSSSYIEMYMAHKNILPPAFKTRSNLQEAVGEVIFKGLEKDPRRRHQSAREFHDDLVEKYTRAKENEDLHRNVLDMQNRVEQRLSEIGKAFIMVPVSWFIRIFRAKGLQPCFVNRSEKKN